mmetsp:Transcript_33582/g.72808  ORF Transcript_33582/g.72808 Transcript_33582/m.72808 type:complete len:104 (+) Transcript_33582:1065-1376(+)
MSGAPGMSGEAAAGAAPGGDALAAFGLCGACMCGCPAGASVLLGGDLAATEAKKSGGSPWMRANGEGVGACFSSTAAAAFAEDEVIPSSVKGSMTIRGGEGSS